MAPKLHIALLRVGGLFYRTTYGGEYLISAGIKSVFTEE
jgi:hypothetical protein